MPVNVKYRLAKKCRRLILWKYINILSQFSRGLLFAAVNLLPAVLTVDHPIYVIRGKFILSSLVPQNRKCRMPSSLRKCYSSSITVCRKQKQSIQNHCREEENGLKI